MKQIFSKFFFHIVLICYFLCHISASEIGGNVSPGMPVTPHPPGWLPSQIVNPRTNETFHSPVPEYWREILRIKDDKNLLREIARAIIGRRHDQDLLQEKICVHQEEVYEFWKKNKWQSMGTSKRDEAIALMERIARIERTKAKNLITRALQKDNFSFVLPNVSSHLMDYVTDMVNTGEVELEMTLFQNPTFGLAPDVRFSLKFSKIYDDPHGILATKNESGKVTETPTNKLILTLGVNEIIQSLSEGHQWSRDRDGTITTLCATS